MIFNGLSSLFSLRPIFLMREFILLRKMSGRLKGSRDCPGGGAEGKGGGLIWQIITEDVPAERIRFLVLGSWFSVGVAIV
jgi:hypothetical protein